MLLQSVFQHPGPISSAHVQFFMLNYRPIVYSSFVEQNLISFRGNHIFQLGISGSAAHDMPPFSSIAKAFGIRLRMKDGATKLVGFSNGLRLINGGCVQVRCLSSIARANWYSNRGSGDVDVAGRDIARLTWGTFTGFEIQRRSFLGCGDGDEGSALSKIHEERRVIGYTPEQLFAVVAAVDLYEDFLPWCQRSEIAQRYPDGSFDAELEIGFKFLVERYISRVVLTKPISIKTTASQSNLFEHLINIWEFSPGPAPGTCSLYFLVDFKFQSPLYRQVASMFFKEVVSRLVSSFTDRCRQIYGPGVPVLENYN